MRRIVERLVKFEEWENKYGEPLSKQLNEGKEVVRCQDCNKTEKRASEEVGHKYCSILAGWVDDNFYCGYGEVRDE